MAHWGAGFYFCDLASKRMKGIISARLANAFGLPGLFGSSIGWPAGAIHFPAAPGMIFVKDGCSGN